MRKFSHWCARPCLITECPGGRSCSEALADFHGLNTAPTPSPTPIPSSPRGSLPAARGVIEGRVGKGRAPWCQPMPGHHGFRLPALKHWPPSPGSRMAVSALLVRWGRYCLTKSKPEMRGPVLCVSIPGSCWHCGYSVKRLLVLLPSVDCSHP